MGVNPVRFAVAVSGGLACLMLGLLAGVSAGTSETDHVMSVQTVTTTSRAQLQAAVDRTVTVDGKVRTVTGAGQQQGFQQANAAARTVTETVTRTVTGDPVTVTETVATPPSPGPAGPGHHHHHHGPGPGDGHGPGPGGPGDGGGPGGDGGGDGP